MKQFPNMEKVKYKKFTTRSDPKSDKNSVDFFVKFRKILLVSQFRTFFTYLCLENCRIVVLNMTFLKHECGQSKTTFDFFRVYGS